MKNIDLISTKVKCNYKINPKIIKNVNPYLLLIYYHFKFKI